MVAIAPILDQSGRADFATQYVARESAPEHTIVFVDPDCGPVSAIRWSRDEDRWIEVPVPPRES